MHSKFYAAGGLLEKPLCEQIADLEASLLDYHESTGAYFKLIEDNIGKKAQIVLSRIERIAQMRPAIKEVDCEYPHMVGGVIEDISSVINYAKAVQQKDSELRSEGRKRKQARVTKEAMRRAGYSKVRGA